MAAELPRWLREDDGAMPELNPRWVDFQQRLGTLQAALPPVDDTALVTIDYDADDPSVVERCLAALHRDGAQVSQATLQLRAIFRSFSDLLLTTG